MEIHVHRTKAAHDDLEEHVDNQRESAMIRRSAALVVLLTVLHHSELPAQDGASGGPPVVDVTSTDFEFEAPDEIHSGWTTVRLTNGAGRSHMMELKRLLEGGAATNCGASGRHSTTSGTAARQEPSTRRREENGGPNPS